MKKKMSWEIFQDFFLDYFYHEFRELDMDFKKKTIKDIIQNNKKYISYAFVKSIDGCNQCGRCCRLTDCPLLDRRTNLCTVHDNQPWDVCREYPFGEFGIGPLSLDCTYMRIIFHTYIEKYFQKCVENNIGVKNE